jgi:hypothetical protein
MSPLFFSIIGDCLSRVSLETMNSKFWSRLLKAVGGTVMAIGTLDPMEGSLLILPGSGLVALGVYLAGTNRHIVLYWTLTFILITVGVAALFGLSSLGGFGGTSGRSLWWGLTLLPYPVGWLMALIAAVLGLFRFCKTKAAKSHQPGRHADLHWALDRLKTLAFRLFRWRPSLAESFCTAIIRIVPFRDDSSGA